jgi:hypothetical protein
MQLVPLRLGMQILGMDPAKNIADVVGLCTLNQVDP